MYLKWKYAFSLYIVTCVIRSVGSSATNYVLKCKIYFRTWLIWGEVREEQARESLPPKMTDGWMELIRQHIIIGPESSSLFTLVTHSLTDWLTHWLLFSKLYWCDPGVWRCQLKTFWLLLLLMLMLRIMLATAFWLGSWRLVIKLKFCSDFEHKDWSRFWSWMLMFGWGYEVESWSRFWS